MDSCSSSPSHSFKDRPRSRHGDLSRQSSFPHNLDRAKSPAPKGVSENRDATRDLARRSYGACGSEKEVGDALLSSPDRSRGSLRRSFGFERVERQRDARAEMHRSARSRTPSRNPDRESGETGGRPTSRRSSHGGDAHRHEVSEVSSSPRHGEKEHATGKKGYDRDSGEIRRRCSSSPEYDGEASKSPISGKGSMRSNGKDAFRGSPQRSVVASGVHSSKRDRVVAEKDCTRTSRMSPGKKDGVEKGKLSSPMKASERERADDMDVTSPKTKLCVVKQGEKHKEQEASSGETDAKLWNKSFSFRSRGGGGGDDACEGEPWLEAKGLHDEAWRESPPPISFAHISKRARSDRDRGRRDEHAGKTSARHPHENEFVKTDAHKADAHIFKRINEADGDTDAVLEAKYDEESSARSVDNGAIHTNEKSFDKVGNAHPVSKNGDNSDMEEGELEPESHPVELSTPSFTEQKIVDNTEGEDIEKQTEMQTCTVSIPATKGTEGILRVVTGDGEEEKMNAKGDEIQKDADDINENCGDRDLRASSADKKEKQGVSLEADMINAQFNLRSTPVITTMTKVLEQGESSKAGQMFDLLGSRSEAKSWNLRSTDKGLDMSSRELTLSLFTEPSEASESSQLKGDLQAKGSNGKQIEKLHNVETGTIRPHVGGSHVGGSGEESSQHSGHKQKKLKMESLQLSLALPGTSNMAVGSNPLSNMAVGANPPRPVEPEKSFQSLNHTQTQSQNPVQSQTYTNSDGFTSSFSFSQSESFIHNPSCSWNCTSLENQELSCGGSRQLSQGTEQMSQRSWPALSGNEQMSNGMHTVTSLSHDKSKHRRGIPLYQRVLQNGNMHQGFPSVTGSNRSSGSNHVSQRSHHFGQKLQEAPKILDSSSQDLEGSGRQVNTHRDIMERVRQQKAHFASIQQARSAEARQESNATQGRDKSEDPPASNVKGPSSAGKDIMVGERNVTNERIGLHEITTEPVAVMAQKLQELPDSILEGLKGVAKGVLCSFEKRDEFIALQENIQRRDDLTEDSLLRAHRTQLEILVALKTGMQEFAQEGSKPQTYKALIEIFLQTRCRNIACQQLLPVSGCECRICSKRSGFCHECMCVVCYKFDSDNNTCRWVGCDLCLHWCHADCGLRKFRIAPTPTDQKSSGNTEMQYHCVACDHKSELFGFVKEVFHKCAEIWGAEALAKELDCVRKIFHESEDMRGKQLCWKAEQMLQKLENKVDAAEVCRSMLRFFNDGNAELDGAVGPNKKPPSLKANDTSGHMAEPARESIPKTTSSGGNKHVDTDNARVVLQSFDRNLDERRTEAGELQYDRARKRAEIEDIETMVRMKQAEVKMFQVRADEARQEAGGLQQIISVKQEKIDEDYACKYAKLRLNEAEERHQKRYEELQALETAQQDFQKMKIRMEAEIKELMLKMEIAKRQFV
eukprot:c22600_g1_i1 orf=213-4493(+)